MRTKLTILCVVTLGLLLQSAAVQASLPCASDTGNRTAEVVTERTHSEHGHHGMHADQAGHSDVSRNETMSCCDEQAASCTLGNCLSSTSLAIPTLEQPQITARVTAIQPARWLPVYAEPPDGFFRPPII